VPSATSTATSVIPRSRQPAARSFQSPAKAQDSAPRVTAGAEQHSYQPSEAEHDAAECAVARPQVLRVVIAGSNVFERERIEVVRVVGQHEEQAVRGRAAEREQKLLPIPLPPGSCRDRGFRSGVGHSSMVRGPRIREEIAEKGSTHRND
jgi:hypothetical protein